MRWWKWVSIPVLLYVVIGGLLFDVPQKAILNESIRNLYFHVPMWFAMVIVLMASMVASIFYLRTSDLKYDVWALESANMGIVLGILGLVTGMIWANYTWGEPWSNDPKQNAAAIGFLIYLAYTVLRGSLQEQQTKARISAVYNILAFFLFIPLIFILPRMTDSLHPGNGGNPGFNAYDLDSRMRLVFYPAVIGWTLLSFWFIDLRSRLQLIKIKLDD